MANTQNLDLVKPLGTDHALVSVLNSNSDKIDAYAGAVNASLDGLRDGLGILANGNTHAAITSGQYVYVKNHSSLPEGLYKATANIAANGTLSTSNLAADSAGGLNSLNEQIAKQTIATGITGLKAYKAAGIVNLVFEEVSVSSASAGWITIGTLPNSLKPLGRNYFQCQSTDVSTFANNNACNCFVDTNGEVKAYVFSDRLSMYLRGFVTYVCA